MELLLSNVQKIGTDNGVYTTCTAENSDGELVYGIEFNDDVPIDQRHQMINWAEKNSLASGNICMYTSIWFIRDTDFTLFTLTWS